MKAGCRYHITSVGFCLWIFARNVSFQAFRLLFRQIRRGWTGGAVATALRQSSTKRACFPRLSDPLWHIGAQTGSCPADVWRLCQLPGAPVWAILKSEVNIRYNGGDQMGPRVSTGQPFDLSDYWFFSGDRRCFTSAADWRRHTLVPPSVRIFRRAGLLRLRFSILWAEMCRKGQTE